MSSVAGTCTTGDRTRAGRYHCGLEGSRTGVGRSRVLGELSSRATLPKRMIRSGAYFSMSCAVMCRISAANSGDILRSPPSGQPSLHAIAALLGSQGSRDCHPWTRSRDGTYLLVRPTEDTPKRPSCGPVIAAAQGDPAVEQAPLAQPVAADGEPVRAVRPRIGDGEL